MAFTPADTASRPSRAHAAKVLPVANAHFARRVRLAEDVRHARMLHSILHRPAEARTGAFLTLNQHEYYARTLATRKRSERAYREFSRQKENLLLLQRLQQIQHKNDGHAGSKAAAIAHQRKHEEVLARLQSRPRVGSSLVFQKVHEASPLSPRNRREWDTGVHNAATHNRREWDASLSNAGAISARDGYRDKVFDRDPPPCDPKSLRERTRADQDSQGRSGLARQVAEERDRIERELARRWQSQSLEDSHSRPVGEEDREWDGTVDGMLRDYEGEAGLGPDEEEEAGDDQDQDERRWSRALDPGGPSSFGTTHRHRSSRPPHQQHRPASEPLDALSSQAITAAMAATAAATDPNAIDHNATSAAAAAGLDTSRHRAIRARYVAEDEDDVELEDEEDSALLHRRAEEEKEEASSVPRPLPLPRRTVPAGLYDLATHPELGLGDEESEAWRLFQYEHAQREAMMQPHAPVAPSGGGGGRRGGRNRRGGAASRGVSAASSAASLRAASEYSAATSSSYATSVAYSAEAAAAADYQDDLDSVLHMLNDETFDEPQQQQPPQRTRSRPPSAARESRATAAPPAQRQRPGSAANSAHARSASAQLRFASGESSEARPQPPSAYTGGSGRVGGGGGRHARTSSMAVRSTHSSAASARNAPPSSLHPPLPPRDPVAAALAAEQRHRANMERAAAEEAERYFAAIEADFPSSNHQLVEQPARSSAPVSSELDRSSRPSAPAAVSYGFQRSTFNARHYSEQQAAAARQRSMQKS